MRSMSGILNYEDIHLLQNKFKDRLRYPQKMLLIVENVENVAYITGSEYAKTHFRLVHSRKAISNFRRASAPNFFFLNKSPP